MNERLRIVGISIVIFAVLLGTIASVQSQGTPFTIYGQVFDSDGLTPVDGVTVNVTNLATGSSVDPVVTAEGGWYSVNLGNLDPAPAHSAGDNIQIVADAGPCKINTTVVPRAAQSPQQVDLILQADDTAPTITDLQPAEGSCVTTGTPEICANYSDATGINQSSVMMKVDGYPVEANVTETGVCYTPTTSLGEGEHTVMVNVSDICSNPNSTSWTFTVDTMAPTISDLMPVDGACVTDSTPEICANYSDGSGSGIDTSSVTMKVDGTPVTIVPTETGVCYTPTTSLGEGGHTVMVNVSDQCGNPSSMSGAFSVDTMPPAIVFNEPPTPENNSEVTVNYVNVSVTVTDSGCGVDTTTVVLVWNGTAYPMIGTGSNYFLNMTDLPNGDHTYRVQANDTAGNPRVSDTRVVAVNVAEYIASVTLTSGYNLISVPVNDTSVTTASTLVAKIGVNCTEVIKWNSTLQQLVSYIPGVPLNNFDIVGGEGYFVNVNNPTIVAFTGLGWESPFTISLVTGTATANNLIGMPVNDTSVTNASTLAAKIGANCTEVVRWDSATQAYVSYIPGVPLNNFDIVGGEGYFVNVVNPTDVMFEGAPWEN